MKWFGENFIDDALPLTGRDRRAVVRDAWQIWMKDSGNIALYAVAIGMPNVFIFFMPNAIDGMLGYHMWWSTVAGFICYTIAVFSALVLLQRFRFAPCVWQELRKRGHDVCPRCGYWLRGLDESVAHCPECGATRQRNSSADSMKSQSPT